MLLCGRYEGLRKARTDTRFEMLRVTYKSDGLPVVRFIYRPSATGDKRPVVV